MPAEVFDFVDYKSYLQERLSTKGAQRGIRSRLARRLGFRPAFISQVLSGKAHFSTEHAIEIDRFLGHDAQATKYFLLLVSKDRAGSAALQRHYQTQLDEILEERGKVSGRVKAQRLAPDQVHRYFSSWFYSAIQVLLLVPKMGQVDRIAARLDLPQETVAEVLEYLVSVGMVEKVGEEFRASASRIHLPSDSWAVHKHHSNWRVRALHSLDAKDPFNLHYSGPLALSRSNAERVRRMLLELIADMEPVVAAPGEEECYGIALDLFVL